MKGITNKQIKLLKNIADARHPVVARWDHADLSALLNRRLIARHNATAPDGSISGNSIWTLSNVGKRYLEEERAGR